MSRQQSDIRIRDIIDHGVESVLHANESRKILARLKVGCQMGIRFHRTPRMNRSVVEEWIRSHSGTIYWNSSYSRRVRAFDTVEGEFVDDQFWRIGASFRSGTMYVHRGAAVSGSRKRLYRKSVRKEPGKVRLFDLCFDLFGEREWVEQMVKELHKGFDRYVRPDAQKVKVDRHVHILTMSRRGLGLKSVAEMEGALECKNYMPDVVSQFEDIVEQVSSKEPEGRLIILRGPAGTGKTFMVRGIIEATKGVRFVLIPAQYVASMMDPSFSALLMRQKLPTCLVIEDADMLLVDRMSDNMTAVSAMLNLADGIFGSLANVRIICTTNADKLEIDPALLRTGRLCADVEVGLLDATRANEIYGRLTDSDVMPFGGPVRLADVYAKASPRKLRAVPNRSHAVGFSR